MNIQSMDNRASSKVPNTLFVKKIKFYHFLKNIGKDKEYHLQNFLIIHPKIKKLILHQELYTIVKIILSIFVIFSRIHLH
jgi:hypothetical protein